MQEEFDTDEDWYRWAWNSRPHVCQECGAQIVFYSRIHVSHIITKGSNKALRRHKENFFILCAEHHHQYEFGKRSGMKIFTQADEIKSRLTREYYENKM